MSKQRTKAQLLEELVQAQNERDKEGEENTRIQRELSEILFPDSKGNWGDIHKVQSWSKIKTRIAELKGKEWQEGMMVPHMQKYLLRENSKLWYLIRVAMKDEKREEPKDYEKMENRFKKADWN